MHTQYKVEVLADLLSTVTDSVLEDVVEWQNRPLEPMYPVVFFDALRVKIRDEGSVKNKAVYLALGIQRDGTKDVLGLWIQQTEGAKFWLTVMKLLILAIYILPLHHSITPLLPFRFDGELSR
jgi:putative transposase